MDLKYIITELKNSLNGFKRRFDQAEELVKLKTGHLKLSKQENKRKKRKEILMNLKVTIGELKHTLWESMKEKRDKVY